MRQSGQKLAARTIMQGMGYDPIEELVRIAQASGTNNDTKIAVAQSLVSYMYPKLSAVEVQTADVEGEVDVRRELAAKILSDPSLADAAHKLSLAAAASVLQIECGRDGKQELPNPLLEAVA